MRTLIFSCMLMAIAYAQGAPSRVELHKQSQGCYSGVSVSVRMGSDHPNAGPSLTAPLLYTYGDSTPLSFSTVELSSRVARLVNIVKPVRKDGSCDSISVTDLILVAEYRFPNSPDFVLLKYRARIASESFFVGYATKSGKLYPYGLETGTPSTTAVFPFRHGLQRENASVVQQFNRMLAENPGVFGEPPECTAALIAMFKYYCQTAPMIVLDSYEDALTAFGMLQGCADMAVAYPLLTFDDLFFSHVSQDSVLFRGRHWQKQYSRWLSSMNEYGYKDSLDYRPPMSVVLKDTVRVIMTVCGGDIDGLRTCEVNFATDGKVVSIDTKAGPFVGPVYRLRDAHGCPPFPALRGWFCTEE